MKVDPDHEERPEVSAEERAPRMLPLHMRQTDVAHNNNRSRLATEIELRCGNMRGAEPMITLEECVVSAGLTPDDLRLSATPSTKHRALLGSYLLNLKRGPQFVRDMMVSDLHSWLDLGAAQQAADLLIVLRQFLSAYPEAGVVRRSARRGRVSSLRLSSADSNKNAAMVPLRLVDAAAPTAFVECAR